MANGDDELDDWVKLEVSSDEDCSSSDGPSQYLILRYINRKWSSETFSEGLLGSFLKRCLSKAIIFPFSAISSNIFFFPIKCFSQSYAGKCGKSMGAWIAARYKQDGIGFLSPGLSGSKGKYEKNNSNEPVCIDTNSGSEDEYQSIWDSAKRYIIRVGEDAKEHMLDLTAADLVEGSMGTIGSAAASSIFVMVAGPPGGLAIIGFFIFDGATKNLSGGVARMGFEEQHSETAKLTVQEIIYGSTRLADIKNQGPPKIKDIALEFNKLNISAPVLFMACKPRPSPAPELNLSSVDISHWSFKNKKLV
jgi:hypothetical protein